MDLENLTKHQIILLTLLVSFVTSIATGIVTVSLMNQAPPSVTRTINQIVEHTVQTVVPASVQNAAAVTTQKTIVVKDDDLVAQSIATLQKSIIRITVKGGKDLIARGVVIDSKGTALTDKAALQNAGTSDFEAILANGDRVALKVKDMTSTTSSLALVTILGTSTGYAPSAIADESKLRLGQRVLGITGNGVDSVGEGVIAMLPDGSVSTATIKTSVAATMPGSVIATQFGEVIGITTADSAIQSPDSYAVALVSVATTPAASAPTPAP